MTRLFVNDVELGKAFVEARNVVGIRNGETGAVVGFYLPEAVRGTIIRPDDECPISEVELLRRYYEEDGRPLADIWKALGVR